MKQKTIGLIIDIITAILLVCFVSVLVTAKPPVKPIIVKEYIDIDAPPKASLDKNPEFDPDWKSSITPIEENK